jgi:hypothetical protein
MSSKVFISYSWTSPDHEEWVLNLSKRLMSDGVDVVIDKWYLKEGQDIYDFMESMVKSPEISKVLIILDKKYTEKADSRSGGVGTETQIITPKIYKNTSQEKFLPIIAERDENSNPFIPTYLEGRKYIDLSMIEHFEENYEKLLRNIYERPSFKKPSLGTPPSYLFTEIPTSATSHILKKLSTQIEKNPERINYYLKDFLDNFLRSIKEMKIEFNSNARFEVGKQICDKINDFTPLRNEFIDFTNIITRIDYNFDIDLLINFFEKLPAYTEPDPKPGRSWHDFEYDNYRFYILELFLYAIAIGLKNSNYQFVGSILNSPYFIINDTRNYKNEPKRFDSFYHNISIIDEFYNSTLSNPLFNPTADLIIKRVPESLTKREIVQADLLCYYVGVLNDTRWFPQTYIYDTEIKLEIFYKLISERHFEKVKSVFGFKTITEFKTKLLDLQTNTSMNDRVFYRGSFNHVTPITQLIDIDKIGTLK